MSIDTLNAYCGHWLVQCPCLAQGRLLTSFPSRFSPCKGSLVNKGGIGLFLSPSQTDGGWPQVSLPRTRLSGVSSGLTLWNPNRFPRDSPVCRFFGYGLIFLSCRRRSNERRERPHLLFRPESRQGDPPNLSILISGGKENNCDALSNGE